MVLNEYLCHYLQMTILRIKIHSELKDESVVTHNKAGLGYPI